MPAIGKNGDLAGGSVAGTGANVLINGLPTILVGDVVASHGPSPHNAAVMDGSSSSLKVNGKFVCRAGDAATCGHTLVSVGTVINTR